MSELSESNYKRISVINWVLTVPMIVLFAWPYYHTASLGEIKVLFRYAGAFVFALPFMLTILHGHVTMAIGTVHRHHYYNWLKQKSGSYGLFYHPVFVSTRFRLSMLIISLLFLPLAWLFS